MTRHAPRPVRAQDTVRFTPTVAQPTFAVREPVLRIKPGTVLISRTNHGPYYTEQGGAFPGEVGPFFVEGATTNDMLKVEIIKVRPNTGLAASQVYCQLRRPGVRLEGPHAQRSAHAPPLPLAPRYHEDDRHAPTCRPASVAWRST